MIGNYRHRITVEVLERTQTSAGIEDTWTEVGQLWAAVNMVDAAARAHLQQIGNPDVQLRMAFREDPARLSEKVRYGEVRFHWGDRVLHPRGAIENIDGQGRRYTVDVGERET